MTFALGGLAFGACSSGAVLEDGSDGGPGVGGAAEEPSDAAPSGGGDEGSMSGSLGGGGATSDLPRPPSLPFVLAAIEDPTAGYCYGSEPCPIGPWSVLVTLAGDGTYEAVFVAVDGSTAQAVELEADGSFLKVAEQVTLINYTYGSDVVPGLCLTAHGNRLRLLDDSGDGVADRLLIDGKARSLGLISSDYDKECGDDEPMVSLEGKVLERPSSVLAPVAQRDPMKPVLLAPELWQTGTARLIGASTPLASAVEVGSFTRAFALPVAVTPGASLEWSWQGVTAAGEEHSGKTLVQLESWPLVTDGSFETDWPWTEPAVVDPEPTVLSGARSLELVGSGSSASFRFLQPKGTHRLRFYSDSDAFHQVFDGPVGLLVEVAPVGGSVVSNATSEPAPCELNPSWCGEDPRYSNGVWRISIEVPVADEDREVLIRLTNRSWGDYGAAYSNDIAVDDLQFD